MQDDGDSPILIFSRVNRNERYLEGAPPGAWGEFNGTGWISEGLFTKWFNAFINFANPSEENVVLLTLNGHSSYVKN